MPHRVTLQLTVVDPLTKKRSAVSAVAPSTIRTKFSTACLDCKAPTDPVHGSFSVG